MTAPPQATHVFTWKIISCNPFFKDESIPLSKLKRPKMWKIPLPVFLHTDGHNRHTCDTFFETNPLWILMSHMPHNPPHLLPGCSWCTTPPNLEDRIVVCWKKLRSVGLVGDFLAGLFWKKEACSKLGILLTFFCFFAWFCSKIHWWTTMNVHWRVKVWRKGLWFFNTRGVSTVVPLLEKKLGAPAGVVVLAEIDSALLFPPLLQGLGQPPNQPNDCWSSGH